MLKTLADFAEKVRSFLGFAAFLVLALVALFLWLFSKGSFDPLISNIGKLSREQFFWLIIIALLMIFVIVMVLIILSYVYTRKPSEINRPYITVIIHYKGDVTSVIEDAKVSIPLIPKSQEEMSDAKGQAFFFFSPDLVGRKFPLNASKVGFKSLGPKVITLKHEAQIFLPLIPDKKSLPSQISIARFSKLRPEIGTGFGYEVLLKNDSDEEIVVEAVELSGIVTIRMLGSQAYFSRTIYEVQLDSAVTNATDGSSVTSFYGSVSDINSRGWGIECKGFYKYELNTFVGYESWEYSLAVPTMTRVSPKNRVFLQIRFKEAVYTSSQETANESEPPPESRSLSGNSHEFTVKMEGGMVLKNDLDHQFLAFIATTTPSRNMREVLKFLPK